MALVMAIILCKPRGTMVLWTHRTRTPDLLPLWLAGRLAGWLAGWLAGCHLTLFMCQMGMFGLKVSFWGITANIASYTGSISHNLAKWAITATCAPAVPLPRGGPEHSRRLPNWPDCHTGLHHFWPFSAISATKHTGLHHFWPFSAPVPWFSENYWLFSILTTTAKRPT